MSSAGCSRRCARSTTRWSTPPSGWATCTGCGAGLSCVRKDYLYASDRLHRFVLGASRDLGRDAGARGLACVHYVDRAAKRGKGLVHRLGAGAAAIVTDDQPVFVARAQAASVAARASVAVFAINAACLVPSAVIGAGIGSRTGFLRRHELARAEWLAGEPAVATVGPYAGPLPFTPDRLDDHSDADLDALVAGLEIDHGLPPSAAFPAGRAAALARLDSLATEVLPVYAAVRNEATQDTGQAACRHTSTSASSPTRGLGDGNVDDCSRQAQG